MNAMKMMMQSIIFLGGTRWITVVGNEVQKGIVRRSYIKVDGLIIVENALKLHCPVNRMRTCTLPQYSFTLLSMISETTVWYVTS